VNEPGASPPSEDPAAFGGNPWGNPGGNPGGSPWGEVPAPPPRPPRRFGPLQGLLLVLGFPVVQTLAGLAAGFGRAVVIGLVGGLRAALTHTHFVATSPLPPGPGFIAASVIAAYVLAALWCRHYALRRAGDRLRRGGPEGFAWCPAPRHAYATATMLAIGTVAVAMAILFVFPVPPTRAPDSQFQALLTPGWMLIPSLLLIFLVAPLAEEFIFRGAVFAAFAPRTGPVWATLIVTSLFVAVHAPEKIHYPPGFVDVALMALGAAWLRLRYRSIRPAVLLHILYNLGVLSAATLVH
jgi:membrane protease YdiL (CAAX protease family)